MNVWKAKISIPLNIESKVRGSFFVLANGPATGAPGDNLVSYAMSIKRRQCPTDYATLQNLFVSGLFQRTIMQFDEILLRDIATHTVQMNFVAMLYF